MFASTTTEIKKTKELAQSERSQKIRKRPNFFFKFSVAHIN